MKFIFDTNYTADELAFIEQKQCEILSEIKLSKTAFKEMPRRMIKYCGTYVAEIYDDGELCWATLGKSRKGEYVFTDCYTDLPSMSEGL